MLHRSRAVSAVIVAGFAGVALAGAAHATDHDAGVPLELEVTDPGSLSMSVNVSEAVILTENGSDEDVRQFEATLPTVTVSDTRTEIPVGTTWAVVGSVGDFVDSDDGARTISGSYLGWSPALVSAPEGGGAVTEGQEVESAVDGGTGVVGGFDLLFAAWDAEDAVAESAEWQATADLRLRVPAGEALPGSYTSTITLSLFESD